MSVARQYLEGVTNEILQTDRELKVSSCSDIAHVTQARCSLGWSWMALLSFRGSSGGPVLRPAQRYPLHINIQVCSYQFTYPTTWKRASWQPLKTNQTYSQGCRVLQQHTVGTAGGGNTAILAASTASQVDLTR